MDQFLRAYSPVSPTQQELLDIFSWFPVILRLNVINKPLSDYTDGNWLKSDMTDENKLCRLWPEQWGECSWEEWNLK